MEQPADIHKMTAHLFRENAGKMTAVLTRILGVQQLDLVMDAVQDTFEAALQQWKFSGPPENPAAWLMQVARHKALNGLKKESRSTVLNPSAFLSNFDQQEEYLDHFFLPDEVADSQLRLLLTCCQPQFSEKMQVSITLHILCGFGVAEIASALLMQEEAVKKMLFRCRTALKGMKNILHTPQLPRYENRIRTVHTILYLMFNEGYKSTRGRDMINHDLCYEAIRLSRLLLKPGVALHKDTEALLALQFFQLARFPARLSSEGEMLSLAEQDRSLWNQVMLEEAHYYLKQATTQQQLSRYHLEAIIASLHCLAPSFEKTDWKSIVFLYEQLELLAPSPMLSLNKIVAESYLHNSAAVLEQLQLLKQSSISHHYLLFAAEGDLLKRAGETLKAKEAFIKALQLARSPLDKLFLENKIIQCNT